MTSARPAATIDRNERRDLFAIRTVFGHQWHSPCGIGADRDGRSEISLFGPRAATRRYYLEGQTLPVLFSHCDLLGRKRSPDGSSLDYLLSDEEIIPLGVLGFAFW